MKLQKADENVEELRPDSGRAAKPKNFRRLNSMKDLTSETEWPMAPPSESALKTCIKGSLQM